MAFQMFVIMVINVHRIIYIYIYIIYINIYYIYVYI